MRSSLLSRLKPQSGVLMMSINWPRPLSNAALAIPLSPSCVCISVNRCRQIAKYRSPASSTSRPQGCADLITSVIVVKLSHVSNIKKKSQYFELYSYNVDTPVDPSNNIGKFRRSIRLIITLHPSQHPCRPSPSPSKHSPQID
jgi:hypothetical protein